MRRLDRYILSETVGPMVLGFSVYTFLMLIRFLFRSAEMIIRRGLSPAEVGKLLLFTLPNILVLTIPMALLFGILIAVGRLASDSELTALRGSGVSLFSLYRPILLLSLLLTGLNTYLAAYLLPRGNYALQQQRLTILTQTAARQVEPRSYQEMGGNTLYVFEVPPDQGGRWHGVFLTPSLPSSVETHQDVTIAEQGRLEIDESGERVVLRLEQAVTHTMDPDKPDRYDMSGQRSMAVVLDERFASTQRERLKASKGVRELTLSELRRRAAEPNLHPEDRNLALVEIHKKLAIPAACLVFGLFAVPLGFNNRRGGRSSGFALSIGVILVYYIMISNGEDAARVGRIPPWLAMWLPNIVFTVLGAVLLARRNRDKSLLLGRLDRWIRSQSWEPLVRRRRRRAEERTRRRGRSTRSRDDVALVLRLPRPRLPFPNLLDRYIMRTFAWILVLVGMSGLVLYVVGDLSENVDKILRNRPPLGVVLGYYQYLSLQILYEIAPIVVLVTTLVTFSLLARSNEVTACKALGVSLYRLAVPALAAAAAVSLGSAVLQAEILPASNQRVAELKDRISGRTTARTYRRYRQWVFGRDGRYMFHYVHFDPQESRLWGLEVFEFDDRYRISRRLYADQAEFTGDGWMVRDGWIRTFEGSKVTGFSPFSEPRPSGYHEPPEYFASELRRPEEMHFAELRSYVGELKRRGERVPELEVELYNKTAFPGISLVMALVALPFGFRLGRRGALYGVGVSIVIGMVFLGIFAFCRTLGEAGALPPLLAVWSPNLIFGMLSLYLLLGVKT